MPMEAGRTLKYVVRSGFDTRVEAVTVARRLTVAGTDGYEMKGPLGVSRVAWKDGVLLAEATSNAWFRPAIPLVAEDGKDRTYHGRIEVLGKESPANATLTHKTEKIEVRNRRVSTTLATLTVKVPKGTIELTTWYQPGIGVVRQEQRTNGQRVVQMQLLSGP